MDAAILVNQLLKIPNKYMKIFSQQDRVEAIVHRSWLRDLEEHSNVPNEFILHDQLSPSEVEAWFKQGENLGSSWIHLLFVVVEKLDTPVIPLPRLKPGGKIEAVLSYYQVLHYVSHTNHKNLWKEAFKKYSNNIYSGRYSDHSTIQLTDSSRVLRNVITRAYGCPILSLDGRPVPVEENATIHPNLLPCRFALEDGKSFILVFEGVPSHTLQDCVMFSPAVVNCHSKVQCLVYQLLCLLRHVHDKGLVLGDITLADIHVDAHLWIQVIPKLTANQYSFPSASSVKEKVKDVPVSNSSSTSDQKLTELTLGWVRGAVNNLDYLTALNNLAGRRFGDPRCHHVMPWVTDFSAPSGANWRDLTKSKFRLNKGDRQLDLTYDLPPSCNSAQVPHHISDVLSEITYYVYLARVTPRSLLCQYVRPQWVPAEYPSSIQRLQQWTPDECIPEFFTDPSVFKSVHPDLPDLEVPSWASSAEQLVAHHRAALESSYVSDRLHHWIDLTFGYKLSGQAAVKSKNVCLQLVDGHTEVTDCGVVQLFTSPHPPRAAPSPYWGVTPPRLHHHHPRPATKGSDEEEGPSSGGEDSVANTNSQTSHSSPLALTRLLSRSRGSLQASGSSPGDKQGSISLPHDYNPVALLTSVEALYSFTGTGPTKVTDSVGQAAQCKQVVAARRQQEMQVLGCLIVEMFLNSKVRLFSLKLSLAERLSVCQTVFAANRDAVPRCFRSLVALLLDDSDSEAPVTPRGTPPPSAHQLLQPALSSSLLPLPPTLPTVYSLVTTLREHTAAVTVLQAMRETHADREDALLACIHKLNQMKVESVAKHLQQLTEHPQFTVDLVLSYVVGLLEDPDTAVSAAWYLFDPIAKALGPVASTKVLLEPMVRLYDCDHTLSSPAQLKKRLKLYHRSFLLRLMVRFRLKTFLDHFITPLVEAVGGYHDVDLLLPAHHNEVSEVEEATECASVTSPLDEDSSADSEKTPMFVKESDSHQQTDTHPQEPEVFVLETEEPDQQQQIASLLLELQTDDADDGDGAAPDQSEPSDGESVTSTEQQQQSSSATEYNKVSEVGVASIQWLSHRLGPVLTATLLSRNLLRMLSLCYTQHGCTQQHGARLLGDENAANVLQCLSDIVGLYGEQFVVVQYLPATADVISMSKKLTASLEAAVVAHLTLLTHCLPLLSDNTLHQLFQEVILLRVCSPALRLGATLRQMFPGGVAARRALMLKLVQCLHVLMLRATTEQKIALVHTMAKFFSVFSKARGHTDDTRLEDPMNKIKDADPVGSFSPPKSGTADGDTNRFKALEELAAVMSPELANWAYGPFASFFGESLMEQSLKNHSFIRQLCEEHRLSHSHVSDPQLIDRVGEDYVEDSVGSFGTNVVVIGNRIDLHEPVPSPNPGPEDQADNLHRTDNNTRHLRGNWLSYWQNEVGNTSSLLDIKQIKLLSFSGHCNSVRALTVLDNENSFLSASRDKTVKVWSIRSMGDGSTVVPAQWTYTGHRKSVLSVCFCEAARLAVSCDSTVHVWDPYVGRVLAHTDPSRSPPVNTLRSLPAPSHQVLAATTDPTLRTLDTRVGGYVNELKVVSTPSGLVRCIAVSPSASWVALGQASGLLTVIDLRTGMILAAWRGHDGEVLQLVAASDTTLVSSSLDQAVSVWNPSEGKLKFNIKGPTEPVHCVDLYGGQLVSGTTANRVGVHSSLDPAATFSSSRLRSDSFRGVLTTLQVLPLNRLLLLGADTGNITLIC
ncbi:WD repeat-containing protein 81-like [Macrosteles quadrilineatus]|uniref:WD repeat-containing protein 81-like n=1 Tax=Macrosteles quadrilineatus TaxID=74068 RepID=UPI0023E2EA85|nr:WD repeat-containing protein 81-like [Macrosteles quadrilineatus]